MSHKFTQIIADNIRKLRDAKGWSQNDLATKMNISRPTISKWENASSEPSSSELAELASLLEVSTELIIGKPNQAPKRIIVVDTSIFIKRPTVVAELLDKFDEVVIPEVVISEINGIKDRKMDSNKQRAWLAMTNLQKFKGNPKLFLEPSNFPGTQINDERIAQVAVSRAKRSLYDKVYIYSDDVYFQFLGLGISNLESITPNMYDERFSDYSAEYDVLETQNFLSLIQSKKLDELRKLDYSKIDINKPDNTSGMTPLVIAIRNHDYRTMDFLLSMDDILDLERLDKSKYNFTALLHSCQTKDLIAMKKLVEAGADVNTCSQGVNHGNTPLMVCAWGGFVDGVKYLSNQDVSFNQQDNNGFTALHKACIKDYYEVAKLLIDKVDNTIRDHKNMLAEQHIKPNTESGKLIYQLFKAKRRDQGL